MEGIPIIKLEIDHMKQTILQALPQHVAALDVSVKAAIEAYCTPENIESVIRSTALQALDAAVKEEVRSFFQYSKPGRQAVREAVIKHLDDWERWNTHEG